MGPYAKNPAAVFPLNYHLVGCPEYSRPVLFAPVDRRLQALLQQKTAELGITMHSLQILPDHVHLFVAADPTRRNGPSMEGIYLARLANRVRFFVLALAYPWESQLLRRYGRLGERSPGAHIQRGPEKPAATPSGWLREKVDALGL